MKCPICGEEPFNLDYQSNYNLSKCKCNIGDLIKEIERLKSEIKKWEDADLHCQDDCDEVANRNGIIERALEFVRTHSYFSTIDLVKILEGKQ